MSMSSVPMSSNTNVGKDYNHAQQSLDTPNPISSHSDRAKARKARIKQLELEQQQWDQEALIMTEVRFCGF